MLAAGPPAAVLLAAIPPGQMLEFPGPVGDAAKADRAPAASNLPTVPRLTAPQDTIAAIGALHPDLIVALGWRPVAPGGGGTFRPATIYTIQALDPDIIILSNPPAKALLGSTAWAGLRAVRDGHAYIAPAEPFGWIEEPPSINRLLGLAWLCGSDPVTLATLFNTIVYHHILTPAQLDAIAGSTRTFKP